MKKLSIIVFLFFISIITVNAEDFSNLNYMDWNLTRQDYSSLNYGNTPFMTNYLGRDYPNARLLLDYTNYTIYPGYYYDIELEYFFDDKTDMGSLNFASGVTSCDIYPYNVSGYTSDGCDIVNITSTSIKIKTSNLRTNSASRIVLQYNNTFNFTNFPTYIVWVQFNSYRLRIIRKDNTGLNNETFEQGINDINNTIINSNNNINNSVNNIDNTITDNSVENPSSDISDFENYIASNSTISSLITLPITLFTKVLDSLNGTCSSYDLGEFRGTHLILPCINISSYIGSTLFNVIDVLISGLFVYKISRKFVAVFEHMSSMKDGDILNG